jgi:hypothetical protein
MHPLLLASALLLGMCNGAVALDLGNQATVKAPPNAAPIVPPAERQGGDTILTAFTIPSLPFTETGTTIGYNDDYDAACPYDNGGPDVVYRFESTMPQSIDVDLCGSDYDTKVYIYDAALHLIACNDDFYSGDPCGIYVSKIEDAPLGVGAYDIVVDCYGSVAGNYVIAVENHVECVVACPAEGLPEGEPPLVPNYIDNHNGGCNTDPGHPFQAITGDADGLRTLCGVGGWYAIQGSPYRDTDWYRLEMGATGTIGILADAEEPSYIVELLPQDCATVAIAQSATADACQEVSMSISGYAPGQVVWFWVGSTTFWPPYGGESEYDYVVWFSGLAATVATETSTWSQLKALYR